MKTIFGLKKWVVKEAPVLYTEASQIEGDITINHIKYDQEEDRLDKEIGTFDLRILDQPIIFPEPNLEGLKPYEVRCSDSDDDDDIVQPIIRVMPKYKPGLPIENKKTLRNASVYESSWQEENETEDYYSNQSSSQGFALILTSSELSNSVVQKIVDLETVLSHNLRFSVRRETIVKKEDVLEILKNASVSKEANGNCLLILIATQVDSTREFMMCGRDKLATIELLQLINSEFALNFAIKPKIVIQVGLAKPPERCRFEEDSGTVYRTAQIVGMPHLSMEKVPNMCHFFIASAIARDDDKCNHLSEMSESFLVNMTEVLNQYGSSSDIIGISTMINARMKQQRSHYHPIARSKRSRDVTCPLYHQLPTYTSTLIRNFMFANATAANVDSVFHRKEA